MFKSKRFFQLSLGALAIAAPMATVISCSNLGDKEVDEYIRKFGELTSKEAKNDLELSWLSNVIKTFDKNFNHEKPWKNEVIKKIVKFFISEQLRKDSAYLLKIAEKLLAIVNEDKSPVYNAILEDQNNLKTLGFLQEYVNGYDEEFFNENYTYKNDQGVNITEKRIERITEILMSERSLDFSNQVYKYLVVTNYLKIDKETFAKYRQAQDEKKYIFTLEEDLINNGQNFLLIKKLLEKRLFFKWEVKETTNGNRFIGNDKQKLENALKQFILNPENNKKSISDYSDYNTKKQKLNKATWDFSKQTIKLEIDGESVTIELHAYLGYKGIISQDKGQGKLDFSLNELRKSTKDYWIGILKTRKDGSKNELITNEINFIPEDQDNNMASLTLLFGIMPIFKDGKLTMVGSHFEQHIDSIAWLLYSNDDSIYNEALKYYADEKNKGGQDIKIEVSNWELKKHWKEVEKLPFIR